MKIGITGTGGYVGGHLAHSFMASGHEVITLSRSNGFSLGRIRRLPKMDLLIHAAYDFKAFGASEIQRVNVNGSRELFLAAKSQGVARLLFISSLAAFPETQSLYGKGKLAVEKCVSELGGIVVRPGTIYGGKEGGIIGTLKKLSKFPVIFLPGGGNQKLFLVHIDDLSKAISILVEMQLPVPTTPMSIAGTPPVLLKELITQLAGSRRHFVSVPEQLALLLLRSTEIILRSACPVRSDSLISLLNSNSTPDFTHALKFTYRAFDNVLTASKR